MQLYVRTYVYTWEWISPAHLPGTPPQSGPTRRAGGATAPDLINLVSEGHSLLRRGARENAEKEGSIFTTTKLGVVPQVVNSVLR